MAMKPCIECKKEISTSAKTCPNCGKKDPTTTTKTKVIAFVVAVFVVLAVFSHFAKDGDGSSSSEHYSASSASGSSTGSLEFVSESCIELADRFGTASKLSDLQKEEAWKAYKGKAFNWKLEVTEVSSDAFGGFTVQYKCAPSSRSLIQDIQIEYEDSRKPFVMTLQKGDVYDIKGVLGHSSSLLGMTGDDLP